MDLRNKNGSITIFVLVGLLFMSAFLVISYANNVNRSKIAKEQFNIISDIYSKGNDEQSYTDAYTDLRNKNKKLMTASSEGTENTGKLELTKTFEDKISNYRIYGNSVQKETPTSTTPVEVQGVGELITDISDDNYGKYKIPVKVTGKNLISELVGGYTSFTNFPQIDAGGSKVFQTVILKNMKAGTYTFSFEKPVNVVRSLSTSSHSSNISIKVSGGNNTQNVTITLIQDEEEYHLSFRDATSATTEWSGWVQCEKGNVATSYHPYAKVFNIYLNEPLRKIGDIVDCIDFKTGKVVINIGVIESYNNEVINSEYISSTGSLTEGATVYYVRDKEIEENISLPELNTSEDDTKIEVLTDVAPSKIEVEYTGYTI